MRVPVRVIRRVLLRSCRRRSVRRCMTRRRCQPSQVCPRRRARSPSRSISDVTDCSGGGTAAGTNVALSGGVAHPSGDVVVPAGGLSFKAHYNGDTKYNAADGPCEPLTGNKLLSSTVTDIHAGAGASDQASAAAILSAAIGSTVHDKATVSGALTTPTGTVNFTVYTNATDCTGPSQAAGTGVALVGGVAHPSSDAVVGVNGLSFKAHYNGNATYLASDGACEPLTPNKLASSTVTESMRVRARVIRRVLLRSCRRRSVRRCMTRRRCRVR